jgi:hypothetical protein
MLNLELGPFRCISKTFHLNPLRYAVLTSLSYQTKANPESDLEHDIMNHTAVVKGSEFVHDAVIYLNEQSTPLPLVLGEVGSFLGSTSDNTSIGNVLGSALCEADFFYTTRQLGSEQFIYSLDLHSHSHFGTPSSPFRTKPPQQVYILHSMVKYTPLHLVVMLTKFLYAILNWATLSCRHMQLTMMES